MVLKNLVLRSINSVDGFRSVNIFQRKDGGVGFARFRRDPEDPHGWRPDGPPDPRIFKDESEARAAAEAAVAWLSREKAQSTTLSAGS